jgi:hypothetical protein
VFRVVAQWEGSPFRREYREGIPTQELADETVAGVLAELYAAGWQFVDWRSSGQGESVEVLERRGRRMVVRVEKE